MRLIKTIILLAAAFSLLGMSAFASSRVETAVGENRVAVTVPNGFSCISKDDIDRDSSFFASLPLSKNEAIERINSEGVVIDAFSNDKMREIKISVSSDSFSRSIINLSPMTDAKKQSVADKLSAVAAQQKHTLLDSARIVQYSGYSFVKYSARVGDTLTGHTYTKILTIIGSSCYEMVCYNSETTLSEELILENDKVFESLKLSIKGDAGELANNAFMTVVSVVIVIISAGFIIFSGYNIIRYGVRRHNREESVKLKKRD